MPHRVRGTIAGRVLSSPLPWGEVGGESDSERLRVRAYYVRENSRACLKQPWEPPHPLAMGGEDARKRAYGSRPLPAGERCRRSQIASSLTLLAMTARMISLLMETKAVIAGHSPSKTGVNALMTRQSIFLRRLTLFDESSPRMTAGNHTFARSSRCRPFGSSISTIHASGSKSTSRRSRASTACSSTGAAPVATKARSDGFASS